MIPKLCGASFNLQHMKKEINTPIPLKNIEKHSQKEATILACFLIKIINHSMRKYSKRRLSRGKL
jgi:hypothetical protein